MVISLEDLRRNDSTLCGSFLKMVDDVKAMTNDPSEQQVILTQMVLNELMMNKNKPEALFSLGFPKKKRSGSSGIQKQSQKPRIIVKFKRCVSVTTGIASYSCSVSNNSGVVVNPDPLCGGQKQDLKLRLRLRSKKRCYSETEQAGSEGSEVINSKRLRKGELPDRICGFDHLKPRARTISIAGEKKEIKINMTSFDLPLITCFLFCSTSSLRSLCM